MPDTVHTLVPHLLLVEDNPGDILLVKESFRDVHTPYRLSIARDGQEAVDFMESLVDQPAHLWPNLVMLDLNLPKMSGHQVLARLKNSPEFRKIPVIVLSTSEAPVDIETSYELAANCYLCKPPGVGRILSSHADRPGILAQAGALFHSCFRSPSA